MKRLPSYLLICLCGVFSVTAGLLTSFAAENESNSSVAGQAQVVAAVATRENHDDHDSHEDEDDHEDGNGHQGGNDTHRPNGQKPTLFPTTIPTLVPTAAPTFEPTAFPGQPTLVVPPATSPEPPPQVMIVTALPTSPVLPTVVPLGAGAVGGRVLLPQEDSFAGITLVLMLPDGTASRTQTDSEGNFIFAGLLPGAYRIDASCGGFLGATVMFTLTDGQQLALPPVALAAGDTNSDNRIDLLDAALVASNLDHAADLIPQADLNHDGMVDVRDLTLIGMQFGKTGPLNWS